jgi:TRAP-type C4-dicarboxylate transport system permease small subunit
MQALLKIEAALKGVLTTLCCVLLAIMVLFTGYTVMMRYIFLNPPFWGDTLTLFANIWLVMLALALSTRDKSHISMQIVYELIPRWAMHGLEILWTLMVLSFGLFLAWYGYQAAMRVPGGFWELGNLPKTYPMLIMPISGALLGLAGLGVLVEDMAKLVKGERLDSQKLDTGGDI